MRYAAFLRAINVGGRNVPMARLKAAFESVGFQSVHTVIASGNVIFESDSSDEVHVESTIEEALLKALGWGADTFVRTAEELDAIVRSDAFSAEEIASAGAYNVAFLNAPPDPEGLERLAAFQSPNDRLVVRGREVYWLCAVRQSESEFSNAVLEKVLGSRSTIRGMSTVKKVLAQMG